MTSSSPGAPAGGSTDTERPLVLIVDDNEKNLKLARDVLRAGGFRTLEAASGAAGIALAAEHLPDVILMDLQLPDVEGRMPRGGSRRPETARIPIVALCAHSLEGAATGSCRRVRRLRREAVPRRRVPRRGAPLTARG